jgi:hypothetical protein
MEIETKDFLSLYKRPDMSKKSYEKIKHMLPLKLNKDVASIVSYITFDGHLAKDCSQLFLSSKDLGTLKNFLELLENRFGIKGNFEECKEGFGKSYKFRVFSHPFCRLMKLSGAPVGNKSVTIFDVPEWVKEDRESSRLYLRVAFDCEGSIWKDKNGYPRIRIKTNKSIKLIKNGIDFMQSIRDMLGNFKIETTNLWEVKGYDKGFIKTKGICFSIKSKSIKNFSEEIGFNIEKKQKRLKDITESLAVGHV